MHSYHIIIGFSDIKLQLIDKCKLTETPNELALWFSLDDGVVYAHKADDHEKCIVVAIRKAKAWQCYLDGRRYGRSVFRYALRLSEERNESVAKTLNELFDSHGTLPWGSG